MCELLIIAQDQTNPDLYLECKRYKRGDVVIVMPDGWGWGNEELASPLFRILQLPNVTDVSAEPLLSWETPSEPDVNPTEATNTYQRRGFHLDITSFPQDVQNWFADDKRAQPTFLSSDISDRQQATPAPATSGTKTTDTGGAATSASTPTADFNSCIVQKAAVSDPKVIGPSPMVIG